MNRYNLFISGYRLTYIGSQGVSRHRIPTWTHSWRKLEEKLRSLPPHSSTSKFLYAWLKIKIKKKQSYNIVTNLLTTSIECRDISMLTRTLKYSVICCEWINFNSTDIAISGLFSTRSGSCVVKILLFSGEATSMEHTEERGEGVYSRSTNQ